MNDTSTRLETRLAWALLVLLGVGCLVVVRPFFSALMWAVVLSFSCWPLYRRLLGVLRGRRALAALVMCLAMVLVILLPFFIIGMSLAENAKELAAATHDWLGAGLPPPPDWLSRLPGGAGEWLRNYWTEVGKDGARLFQDIKRFLEPATAGLVKIGLALGTGLVQLSLSILITFFLFRDGLSLAERLSSTVVRLGGERGRQLLEVAGNTIRGVVYGIIGTALVQAVIAGIGFVIAGVPGAAVLTLITFFLSVVPMGPPLVWGPAALWLFHRGETGWGIFMLVWGLIVSSVDNFVKPWLISQGSSLPFILIFFGVIGGALAFGFIGVFLGPTLLALGYQLIRTWLATRPVSPGEPVSGAGAGSPAAESSGASEAAEG